MRFGGGNVDFSDMPAGPISLIKQLVLDPENHRAGTRISGKKMAKEPTGMQNPRPFDVNGEQFEMD